MRRRTRNTLVRTTRWRLTLLNAVVLYTILLIITCVLYGTEFVITDAEMNQLLTRTVQQARSDDPMRILLNGHPMVDPPQSMSPAPLQAFFLLLDVHGRIYEGASYHMPGLPNQAVLRMVLSTGVPDTRDVTIHNLHLRLLTIPVRDKANVAIGVIQAYVSLEGRDGELERLLLVLLVGSALGVALSIVAAGFLARRALVPIWRAFEQQEKFVADASHELRAPLALLQADVEVLKRALGLFPPASPSPIAAESIQHIDDFLSLHRDDVEIIDEMATEIGHMNTLITDLLTLAKYDATVPTHPHEIVHLVPLLINLAGRMKGPVAQAHLTFHLLLPNDSRVLTVMGDSTALHQLFMILLTNAITYTPEGGHIWLQGQLIPEEQVQISVHDTGTGISVTDLPHLFTRFYRADKARSRHNSKTLEHTPSGIGLGLAIAHTIIEQHSGKITASSPGEGQGSTFTVYLRRYKQPLSEQNMVSRTSLGGSVVTDPERT